jgi:hypothetical protein
MIKPLKIRDDSKPISSGVLGRSNYNKQNTQFP